MKKPRHAPSLSELLETTWVSAARVEQILKIVTSPTVGESYPHWDNLCYRTPPEGLTQREWWLALKLRRVLASWQIPLRDKAGNTCQFNLSGPILAGLNKIDLMAGGTIGELTRVTDKKLINEYLIKVLAQESITSSLLEGAPATYKVAEEMIRQGRRPRHPGEQMIANNYKAMERIIELKDEDLTPEIVLELQGLVTERTLDDPSGAGRLRRGDESRVVGDEFGEVFHEPPEAAELPGRLAAMCDFANGRTPSGFVHPVIRAMIVHYWLAYDHPFIDGNGRTARVLFYWSMLKRGYWLFEYISISRIILDGPKKYGMVLCRKPVVAQSLRYA